MFPFQHRKDSFIHPLNKCTTLGTMPGAGNAVLNGEGKKNIVLAPLKFRV